ncbi:MFS transporter, partial [Candidatus Megaera venefica]|uniref:MFS transporter n=1 Tax=Candidatus Megaera venefica TaxID=2055910 RepID=UPI002AD3BD1E
MPDLQQKFGLSSFMAQLSLSLNFIGYCIGILLSGILGDKFNYRTIILYHLLFFILATLLCVITSNYKFFLLGRFIQGISIASPTIL